MVERCSSVKASNSLWIIDTTWVPFGKVDETVGLLSQRLSQKVTLDGNFEMTNDGMPSSSSSTVYWHVTARQDRWNNLYLKNAL